MWEADVRPRSPLKLALTVNRCVLVSRVTSVEPVPGEAFGGASAGPLSVPKKEKNPAWLGGAIRKVDAASSAAMMKRFMCVELPHMLA